MINKEEIERAKWRVKHKNFFIQIKPSSVVCIDCISNNRNKHIEAEIDIDSNLDDAIETLFQYIDQLEQENNKLNKMIDEMAKEISAETLKKEQWCPVINKGKRCYTDNTCLKCLKQYFETKGEIK